MADKIPIINNGGQVERMQSGDTVPVANGGTGVTTSTGTGDNVLNTSPTLITPALGTPISGVMTNVTGTAVNLISGSTNALKSATTTVDVAASAAPSLDQVLTATGPNGATWQTPSGATGAGGDLVFQENQVVVTTSYTLRTGRNAMVVGPLTTNNGVSVTVPTGQRLVIL